jgi:hypothetical protein
MEKVVDVRIMVDLNSLALMINHYLQKLTSTEILLAVWAYHMECLGTDNHDLM